MLNLHNYPEIKFPEDFVWGSATSAHQIEGDDIHSINWRDQTEHPETFIHHSGKACNSYALFREDVELLKTLGHKAYRFSIPWARIEPEEGKLFMYIFVNDNGKRLYVLECRETLLVHILNFAPRSVLESDYVKQEKKKAVR